MDIEQIGAAEEVQPPPNGGHELRYAKLVLVLAGIDPG